MCGLFIFLLLAFFWRIDLMSSASVGAEEADIVSVQNDPSVQNDRVRNPCSLVTCPDGSECVFAEGKASCKPVQNDSV